jgi:hypothetical protein
MAPYILVAFQWRKPGTTPEEFKKYYENVHIPILVDLAGPTFPKTHTRHYVTRIPSDPSSSDKTNANFKAAVHPGTGAEDFDYDVWSEMVWEDADKAQAFGARFASGIYAEKLAEDSANFVSTVKMVMIDEPLVTTRQSE